MDRADDVVGQVAASGELVGGEVVEELAFGQVGAGPSGMASDDHRERCRLDPQLVEARQELAAHRLSRTVRVVDREEQAGTPIGAHGRAGLPQASVHQRCGPVVVMARQHQVRAGAFEGGSHAGGAGSSFDEGLQAFQQDLRHRQLEPLGRRALPIVA